MLGHIKYILLADSGFALLVALCDSFFIISNGCDRFKNGYENFNSLDIVFVLIFFTSFILSIVVLSHIMNLSFNSKTNHSSFLLFFNFISIGSFIGFGCIYPVMYRCIPYSRSDYLLPCMIMEVINILRAVLNIVAVH